MSDSSGASSVLVRVLVLGRRRDGRRSRRAAARARARLAEVLWKGSAARRRASSGGAAAGGGAGHLDGIGRRYRHGGGGYESHRAQRFHVERTGHEVLLGVAPRVAPRRPSPLYDPAAPLRELRLERAGGGVVVVQFRGRFFFRRPGDSGSGRGAGGGASSGAHAGTAGRGGRG